MAITLTNPLIVPEQSFTNVAVTFLRLDWADLNGKVTASFVLQPYSTDEYGVNTESPTPPITDKITDVLGLAATRAEAGKPALANAVAAVLSALQEIEHELGKI